MLSAQASEIHYPSIEHSECPYPLYDDLREQRPVVITARGEYLVSRHADVHFGLAHPELFSSNVGAVTPRDNPGGYLAMMNTDPPDHAAKRRLAFNPFKPARLKQIRPQILQIVDAVIDAFIDDGEVDLMADFAMPIPIKVTSHLMGLDAPVAEIKSWATLEGSGRVYLDEEGRRKDAEKNERMVSYLLGQLRARVENPGDDALSEMIAEQTARDGSYNEVVVQAEATTVLLGGIVTTAHMIASAMSILLDDPKLMARVRAESAIIPRLLEEVLRVESPVQWRPRRCVKDTEIAGTVIPQGALVFFLLAAGNRDERCFKDAATFDPERANVKRHLAFGYGPHSCLGAPLARIEGTIALERLLGRLRQIELKLPVDQINHIRSVQFRSPAQLPVAFTRADTEDRSAS